MKKLILTTIALLATLSTNSQPLARLYGNGLLEENNCAGFSLHSGAVGRRQNMEIDALGFSIIVYGLYFDYLAWHRDKKNCYKKSKLGEDMTECFHFGYQLPVTKWLRITPLIGKVTDEKRGTETLKYNLYTKEITSIITPGRRITEFDYGAQIMVNISTNERIDLNLHGTITKYCEYCGIGVGIKL